MIKITITLSMDFALRKSRYVVIVCRNHFLQLVFPRKLLRDSIDSFSIGSVGFHNTDDDTVELPLSFCKIQKSSVIFSNELGGNLC